MTCRERLKLEHPEFVSETILDDKFDLFDGGCKGCPHDYGYLEFKEGQCCGMSCTECWDREISETEDFKCDTCEHFKGMYCGLDIPCVDYDQYKYFKEDAIAPRKTKVICVSGHAQHGKDSTALFLKEALEVKGKKVLIAHYGDLVKYVCKTFFDWNGEKNEAGRTLLQYIGTDVIRAQTPNYWVDFILSILKHFPDTWDYVLIPDCRFPNELDGIKNAGWDMTHIRVVRRGHGFVSPLTEEQQKHISETALDGVLPNCIVMNRGTLDDLKECVYELAGYLEGNTNDIH